MNARRHRALADICDTFLPGSEASPSASHLGVSEAFLTLAETEFRPADLRQLRRSSRYPAWDAIGYPGPPGRVANPPPKAIQPMAVD